MSDIANEVAKFKAEVDISCPDTLESEVLPLLEKLPEMPHMELLQNRLQLGLLREADHRWEAVDHTRYEHSIGVIAKCVVAADIINFNTEENRVAIDTRGLYTDQKITRRDLLELCVAASLHDLGHLPFSHATERAVLNSTKITRGLKHEERIDENILLHEQEYFKKLRELIEDEWGMELVPSMKRISTILRNRYEPLEGVTPPKKAIMQMLSSSLDFDRMDFILRDSEKTGYLPVLAMKESLHRLLNGFVLVKVLSISETERIDPERNIELCLLDSHITEAFHMLVARILLYKYVYFHPLVRGLEGVLTHIVGELMTNGTHFPLLEMIQWSEDFFMEQLKEWISAVSCKKTKDRLGKLLQRIIAGDQYYDLYKSVRRDQFKNPRLSEEFVRNINRVDYKKTLHGWIVDEANRCSNDGTRLAHREILIDPFIMDTNNTNMLVFNSDENEVSTLSMYMNGSNMNKVCAEERLDIYIGKHLGQKKKRLIDEAVTNYIEM